MIQVLPAQLFVIIGEKEVELIVLRERLAQLEAEKKAATEAQKEKE